MNPDISKIKIGDRYLYEGEVIIIEDIVPCIWNEHAKKNLWCADTCYNCVGQKVVNGEKECYTLKGISKLVIIEEDFLTIEDMEI